MFCEVQRYQRETLYCIVYIENCIMYNEKAKNTVFVTSIEFTWMAASE